MVHKTHCSFFCFRLILLLKGKFEDGGGGVGGGGNKTLSWSANAYIDENQKNPSVPRENLKYKTVPRDVFPILHQSQNLF